MSKKTVKTLASRPGYDIGYAKPPEQTRFKKGHSGNPKGRPRGSKNKRPALHEERMKGIIFDEAYRGVEIREGDRMVTIPMAQAVMRSIAVSAAKGHARAQRLFSELLAAAEEANRSLHLEWIEAAITYKSEWDRELDRRKRLGITGLPEPLPHPDHIVVDLREGTANIVGPATKEEKEVYDDLLKRRDEFAAEVMELTQLLEATADDKERKLIAEDIARSQRIVDIIDGQLRNVRRAG